MNHKPMSQKDKHRLHELGKKMRPGIFMEYTLRTGGGWTGDLLIADWENIHNHSATEIHV